jgi:hypothetical protein
MTIHDSEHPDQHMLEPDPDTDSTHDSNRTIKFTPDGGVDQTADTSPAEDDETQPSTDGAGHRSDTPSESVRRDAGSDRLRWLVTRALLLVFTLLAFIAAIQFYVQIGSVIDTWVAPPYQSIVSAGVNLAVLLIAVAGVSHQLRRLVAEADPIDR